MSDTQPTETDAAVEPDVVEAEASLPIIRQIRLDKTGLIVEATETNLVMAGFIEVSPEVFQQAMPLVGKAHFFDGEVVPMPAPPPPPIVLSADVLFFDRMTDSEYDDLDASVRAGETARVYRGWAAATSFSEGSDMWALLVKHLNLTATTARRDELLARP